MSDLRTALLGGMAAGLVPSGLVSLEDAMADWRRAVHGADPQAPEALVRTVCEEVVHRAHILAEGNRLNRAEVAAFLLTRSRQWVLGGLPVTGIATKLPKTLGDLGMLKITEGGKDGEPLDTATLKMALAAPKHRIIQ